MPAVLRSGLMNAKATLLQPDGTLGPGGAPSGNYVPITGLTNLACIDAVPRVGTIEATEMREIKEIQAQAYRHVALAGDYFAALFPLVKHGLQCSITDPNGTAVYMVFGVEPDSQATQTRLHLVIKSV
ncbi:MAG TPA: hypothetical protein VFO46_02480 [Candidatus Sulfotelmatobacter sp.]|nr:hypothetical protein [Candidatus Sulfotelmatobacter sp.]